MNHAGAGRWRAFSAGSKPVGAPNPLALATLEAHSVSLPKDAPPRSKSWNEFAGAETPPMDVVVTVCDNTASETCPVWPHRNSKSPRKLHWSFPDPAAATGGEAERRLAFTNVFSDIRMQIDKFLEENSI